MLTLAIYLFPYFGIVTLLTTFPKPRFGAGTSSVLSSVTKVHGLWVYKEFGAHSAWLLCKAMTQRNLKFLHATVGGDEIAYLPGGNVGSINEMISLKGRLLYKYKSGLG